MDSQLEQSAKNQPENWLLNNWYFILFGIFMLWIVNSIYKNRSGYYPNDDMDTAIPADLKLRQEPIITEKDAKDKIAIINIAGSINQPTSEFIIAKLRSTAADPAVKAILLKVNSSGGGANESDLIWNEMLKVKASSKPIVAFFNGIAASAAYYISTPADKIIATPGTWTGSIGVIAVFPNYSGLMQKLGLEMVTIKSGEQKDMLSPFRPTTGEEKAIVQQLVNESFDNFVEAVSRGRKMTKVQVLKLSDGRVYSAKQAKQNGLIDEIGYFEDAIKIAKELAKIDKVAVVEIQESTIGFTPLFQKLNYLRKTGPRKDIFLKPGIYRINLALYLNYYQNQN